MRSFFNKLLNNYLSFQGKNVKATTSSFGGRFNGSLLVGIAENSTLSLKSIPLQFSQLSGS